MNNFITLKNITSKIGSGATPRGGSQVYQLQGISFIRSQNVQDMHFSKSGLVFLNDEQANQLKGVTVKPSDVLLNITGDSIARSCLVPDEVLSARVNQHVSIIRCKNSKDAEFVAYYLQFLKPYLLQICKVGGTRNALTKDAIENLKVNFLADRHARGGLLALVDKKIELNNRINAELEAMAKTLYDYWFVQFDFPDANGNPYKTSGGKMAYNPTLKREIPEGWQYSTIGAIEPNIVTGKTPSKDNSEYFGGNVPFITIGDIRGNTYVVSTEETLTEQGASTQKNKFLPEDSICVTCIASPGLVGFVTTPAQTNQQINSIICGSDINKYYLYFAIKSYFEGAKAKTGNTFANMNKGDFSSIGVLKPSSQVLRLYHKKVYQLFQQIKCRSLEIQQLVKLRDWLLPMLMNGQLTIGSAN